MAAGVMGGGWEAVEMDELFEGGGDERAEQ